MKAIVPIAVSRARAMPVALRGDPAFGESSCGSGICSVTRVANATVARSPRRSRSSLLWQLAVSTGFLNPALFPAPLAIAAELPRLCGERSARDERGLDAFAARSIGCLIGGIPGTLIGLAMGMNRWVRAYFSPVIALLYPIPKIAILPLFYFIFGTGEQAKWAAVAVGVFFLMAINTEAGVRQIDPIYLDVARAYRIRPARSRFACCCRARCRTSTPGSNSASGSRSCSRSPRSFSSRAAARLRDLQRAAVARRRPALRGARRRLVARVHPGVRSRPDRALGDPVAPRTALNDVPMLIDGPVRRAEGPPAPGCIRRARGEPRGDSSRVARAAGRAQGALSRRRRPRPRTRRSTG